MSAMRVLLIVPVLALSWLAAGAAAPAAEEELAYRLGSGDRIKITVFREEDLSGEFEVDGQGYVSMPLIGEVSAGGLTVRQLEKAIEVKLLDGFLKEPRVAVEVLNYRPFYIIGEVNKPGSYPYVSGMTVLNAVALGGGFTYRADEDDIVITRSSDPERRKVSVEIETKVLPGDIIRVKERFF